LRSYNAKRRWKIMLTDDQKWIYEHFSELVDKYAGKYVSVEISSRSLKRR